MVKYGEEVPSQGGKEGPWSLRGQSTSGCIIYTATEVKRPRTHCGENAFPLGKVPSPSSIQKQEFFLTSTAVFPVLRVYTMGSLPPKGLRFGDCAGRFPPMMKH